MRIFDTEGNELESYDEERGSWYADEMLVTDDQGNETWEQVIIFEPNPGNKTHDELLAESPMSNADALLLLLKAKIDDLPIDDATAYRMQRFHPEWQPGTGYEQGERRTHQDVLYRCLATHVSQDGWEPPNAPSLWARVLPGQQGTDIGEWVQPDSTNPYMKGDRVTHNGFAWESEIDNNVWEPGVYGWAQDS